MNGSSVIAVLMESDIWVCTAAGTRSTPVGVYDDAGTLIAGAEAWERGQADLDHYEPHPWTYLRDTHLVLRHSAHAMRNVVATVLARAGLVSASVDRIVLVHPTHWSPDQTAMLESVLLSSAGEVILVPFALALTEGVSERGDALVIELHWVTYCATLVRQAAIASIDFGSDACASDDGEAIRRLARTIDANANCFVISPNGGSPGGDADGMTFIGPQHVSAIAAGAAALAGPSLPEGNGIVPVERFGLPPMPGRKYTGRWVGAAAAVVALLGLLAAVVSGLKNDEPHGGTEGPSPALEVAAPGQDDLRGSRLTQEPSAQIGDVAFTLPESWYVSWNDVAGEQETGDFRAELRARENPEHRILLALTSLRSGVHSDSAVTELRRELDADPDLAETAGGAFLPRHVALAYEELTDRGWPLQWYVVLAGGRQLTVGCDGGPDAAPVDYPCLVVLESLQVV
ncbi:type VII secretion-associated protein [Hoyosella altamirensis]|uniref:Type VII secretion-associated protein (TIGR03931 family) n=1 Tax=Hoyosella altamirensis TaxID=616997 RepID=A0A839RUS6_9ACTN|nr:type VII secretion-associated protein [Hoyosella altamirensis]MBB3039643.1 type VII secretion-associated protein (TIGR03931 family) [Hoyosella altamirensis]